jgi:predicted transcriptional regulator
MSEPEEFYNLLFELSNEYRHGILRLLQKQARRMTDIARALNLNNPETRRHITRLRDIGLIHRNLDNFYQLTPFGELILKQLLEIAFTSQYRTYFESHSVANLPLNFIKHISDLRASQFIVNIMDVLYNIEAIIKEAEEYVWFNVDQYPVTTLSAIVQALERGVEFRTIEHEKQITGPHLSSPVFDDVKALHRVKNTPLIDQRLSVKTDVIIYLSEKQCLIAFPTITGEFDYRGFIARDTLSLEWCKDLFLHYWNAAEPKIFIAPTEYTRSTPRTINTGDRQKRIRLEGRNASSVDVQAVQDAVDHYDEVILHGTFNFGSSQVQISRSVVIKGDGRDNEVPITTIYKKGWRFPFTEFDAIFKVDGVGADVTIENIQFTDFNHTCILGIHCNNLHIKQNHITLMTGFGRGQSFGAFGDVVIGIMVGRLDQGIFEGTLIIEGNHIDLARGGAFGGFLTRGGLEDDSEYRPDLFNHEYYMGFGIAVHRSSQTVRIENNTIRNANARGIATTCNLPTADVQIHNNRILSDVYGSYPFASLEAGVGILAQSAWGFPSPGFNVDIEENTITLDKINHSGIIVLGPVTTRKGAGKLRGGMIRNNRIHLTNGYEGIHVRKCDEFTVANNTLTGTAYYGIRISGRKPSKTLDLRALYNVVDHTNMNDLRIKNPDSYSTNHADGRMFALSHGNANTAHIWLDAHTSNNVLHLHKPEQIIDQGEDNTIQYA